MNEDCPDREKCGPSRHLWDGKKWVRCLCLQKEIERKILGPMFSPEIVTETLLWKHRKDNLLIEGPVTSVKKHIARVILNAKATKATHLTIDAYRLIEIFLGEDKEIENQAPVVDTDYFFLLLGFGDPRNKYLPELIMQVLSRREMRDDPTWVILGLPKETIATRYGADLATHLLNYKKVNVS